MKFSLRNPFLVLGVVLSWRVLLLVFTAQPIPANDAFFFDGAVVNWLQHAQYFNPTLAIGYPISSGQVFSVYPPGYQVAAFLWMSVFGTSALSAMTLHLALISVAALLVLFIVRKFFPATNNVALAVWLFFGVTFNDRPEDLAHIFGLTALLLVTGQISRERRSPWLAAGIVLSLLLTLYTSLIVGAFYFGAGFLACAAAWCWRRQAAYFLPFFFTALLFAVITLAVAKLEPVWWQGFLENANKQPILRGAHAPRLVSVLKLIRTLPVFLVALALVPFVWARRRQIAVGDYAWFSLMAGIFAMGWVLMLVTMTLLGPEYVVYAIFVQVLLAAGLLVLVEKYFPAGRNMWRAIIMGCVLLVSIRAVGMTTWGAACAWKNSYASTQATLRHEWQPFLTSSAPVVISSPYLYGATDMGVRHPVHSDWFYDRALTTPNADLDGFMRLRPAKLVVSQFDYYRSFEPLLAELRLRPELVEIHVRDLAAVRTPDSMPAMQRVVQHISWAPVIVDLDWKNPSATTP